MFSTVFNLYWQSRMLCSPDNTLVIASLPLVSKASIPIAQNKKLSLVLLVLKEDAYQSIAVRSFSRISLV